MRKLLILVLSAGVILGYGSAAAHALGYGCGMHCPMQVHPE